MHGRERLRQHKIFLSVGDDEYWSREQRRNVELARVSGVHLQFWSGNEMFWKIRWEASPTESQPQAATDEEGAELRTMVCYKDTQEDVKLDPSPGHWTGTFRDARRINPEASS